MAKHRRDFEHRAEEIEQLFADLWQVFPLSRGLRRVHRPQVDVYRTDEPPTLTVLVELPGVEPSESRWWRRRAPSSSRASGPGRRTAVTTSRWKWTYGPFQRQVTLAEDVDPDRATATYERGILAIQLPVAPKDAPGESVSIPVRLGR